MVLQEDSVIFISTVRFSNSVYNDTDQKIKQICLTPGEGRVSRAKTAFGLIDMLLAARRNTAIFAGHKKAPQRGAFYGLPRY
jgi:hypothetical protein